MSGTTERGSGKAGKADDEHWRKPIRADENYQSIPYIFRRTICGPLFPIRCASTPSRLARTRLSHWTLQMAPSLEEPLHEAVADAFENPLKKKPELVAPEPGTWLRFTNWNPTNMMRQNTAQVPSPNKQGKAMLATAVRTKQYVPLHPKAPIQIFLSSPNDLLV